MKVNFMACKLHLKKKRLQLKAKDQILASVGKDVEKLYLSHFAGAATWEDGLAGLRQVKESVCL